MRARVKSFRIPHSKSSVSSLICRHNHDNQTVTRGIARPQGLGRRLWGVHGHGHSHGHGVFILAISNKGVCTFSCLAWSSCSVSMPANWGALEVRVPTISLVCLLLFRILKPWVRWIFVLPKHKCGGPSSFWIRPHCGPQGNPKGLACHFSWTTHWRIQGFLRARSLLTAAVLRVWTTCMHIFARVSLHSPSSTCASCFKVSSPSFGTRVGISAVVH